MDLADVSPMPQKGKYKGFRMENVPYWYLLWLNDQTFCLPEVKKYIANNMDVLLVEQKRDIRKN
jgi:uncharacterized protein (DUF3820 family)